MLCHSGVAPAIWSQPGGQPIVISLFNESTRMPFSALLEGPFHPGLAAGTEFSWKESKRFRLYPSVNAGYLFHRRLFHGFFINAELGLDYKTATGFVLKTKVGSGYLRSYSLHTKYVMKEGRYVAQKDKGRSRFMPSFTIGAGYQISPLQLRSPELFVLYQSWIEFPYSPGFIPLLPHSNLCIGTKFFTSKATAHK
jgi:hypothetical protein